MLAGYLMLCASVYGLWLGLHGHIYFGLLGVAVLGTMSQFMGKGHFTAIRMPSMGAMLAVGVAVVAFHSIPALIREWVWAVVYRVVGTVAALPFVCFLIVTVFRLPTVDNP